MLRFLAQQRLATQHLHQTDKGRHMLHLAIVVTAEPEARLLLPADTRAAWDLMPGPWRVDNRWLGDREAWECSILVETKEQAAEALRIVRERLAGRRVDINMVPSGKTRRKRLLVADMESTIIEQECLDELADFVGKRLLIASITERAMRGELDFEAAIKERVSLLKGLDAEVLEKLYKERVTLMPGATALVATMKKHGATCALVSGGFTYFTLRVAQRLGFDIEQANTLILDKGKIKGTVGEPILGREAKRAALERISGEKNIAPDRDARGRRRRQRSRHDPRGGPRRCVPRQAKGCEAAAELPNGAVITHGDLTSLLYRRVTRKSLPASKSQSFGNFRAWPASVKEIAADEKAAADRSAAA